MSIAQVEARLGQAASATHQHQHNHNQQRQPSSKRQAITMSHQQQTNNHEQQNHQLKPQQHHSKTRRRSNSNLTPLTNHCNNLNKHDLGDAIHSGDKHPLPIMANCTESAACHRELLNSCHLRNHHKHYPRAQACRVEQANKKNLTNRAARARSASLIIVFITSSLIPFISLQLFLQLNAVQASPMLTTPSQQQQTNQMQASNTNNNPLPQPASLSMSGSSSTSSFTTPASFARVAGSPASQQLAPNQIGSSGSGSVIVLNTQSASGQQSSQGQQQKPRYSTMYACENRTLSLDCGYGARIKLIRANFGRFSVTQCNEQGLLELSTECMSPVTFRKMESYCENKQSCSVNATSAIFGDRCPRTPKYLEVHFQCQQDPLAPQPSKPYNSYQQPHVHLDTPYDVLNLSKIEVPAPPMLYNPSINSASSSIQPPNNPNYPSLDPYWRSKQPPVATRGFASKPTAQATTSTTVMNSPILTVKDAEYVRDSYEVVFRHQRIDNMSNPRCYSWDPNAGIWTDRGNSIVESNSTHTKCAFERDSSYMLVMDLNSPSLSIVNEPSPLQPQPSANQDFSSQWGFKQQTPVQPQPPISLNLPPISPYPEIFNPIQPGQTEDMSKTNPPIIMAPPSSPIPPNSSLQQPPPTSMSSVARVFAVIGYLAAVLVVTVIFASLAFVAVSMRCSLRNSGSTAGRPFGGRRFKSLGNFVAFNGSSASKFGSKSSKMSANRHQSDTMAVGASLRSKDLLVINNQAGHQFLYSPAGATKISNSASTTHIFGTQSGTPTLHHQHPHQTLQHLQHQHQLQQQQLYSGTNVTLSQLSSTGAQSNNHYYGMMPYIQQQQHLGASSYHQQATKSSASTTESANSTPSSSGVESGNSASTHNHQLIQQQQQQHQQQQQQAHGPCLLMDSPSRGGGYGCHSMTLNSQYGGAPMHQNHQQHHPQLHQQPLMHFGTLSGVPRDHIYECVDDERQQYASRLLPIGVQSTRVPASSLLTPTNRNQVVAASSTGKRIAAPRTNIVCSKLDPMSPQRATNSSNKNNQQQQQQLQQHQCHQQHDLMSGIYGTEPCVQRKLGTDC